MKTQKKTKRSKGRRERQMMTVLKRKTMRKTKRVMKMELVGRRGFLKVQPTEDSAVKRGSVERARTLRVRRKQLSEMEWDSRDLEMLPCFQWSPEMTFQPVRQRRTLAAESVVRPALHEWKQSR